MSNKFTQISFQYKIYCATLNKYWNGETFQIDPHYYQNIEWVRLDVERYKVSRNDGMKLIIQEQKTVREVIMSEYDPELSEREQMSRYLFDNIAPSIGVTDGPKSRTLLKSIWSVVGGLQNDPGHPWTILAITSSTGFNGPVDIGSNVAVHDLKSKALKYSLMMFVDDIQMANMILAADNLTVHGYSRIPSLQELRDMDY